MLSAGQVCCPYTCCLRESCVQMNRSIMQLCNLFCRRSIYMVQDAVVWNATYIVRGRQAIFGAFQLWCALNHIEIKINRIGESLWGPLKSVL